MVQTSKIPLANDEIMLDSWDLYYTFSNGKNYFGTMTVTTKRIFFETNSQDTVIEILETSKAFVNREKCVVEMDKDKIISVETEKYMNYKKAILLLDNGEKHILDRKMLAIDKITKAIQRK